MKRFFWLWVLPLSGCVLLTNAFDKGFCGDGLLELGVEECDDGNNADGDDCRADCTLPPECQNQEAEEGEICLVLGASAAAPGPALQVADLNNDEHLDLLSFDASGQTPLVISFGDGLGDFTPQAPLVLGNNAPADLRLGDIDGDNDLDLVAFFVVLAGLGNRFDIFLNNGDGTFAAGSQGGQKADTIRGAVADLNGDGFLDVLASDALLPRLTVFLGDGNGAFLEGDTFGDLVGLSFDFFTLEDFDQDGDLDIIASPRGPAIVPEIKAAFFTNNSDATFEKAAEIGLGKSDVRGFLADDLDGDGDLDLTFVDLDTETASFLLNDGSGDFGTPIEREGANKNDAITTGDFNKDGQRDIVVASSRDEEDPLILFSEEAVVVEGDFELDAGELYEAIAAGDFNEDGAIDLAASRVDGVDLFLSDP